MERGTRLFVVPTPIGNLKDITLRALEVLKEVDLVLAEDTRTTGKLFKHYEIRTPLRSYHIHNEHRILDEILVRLEEGEQMALVSDAGTPGISDPGFLLVRECQARNLEVECLPGATAFVPALIKSGFPSDRFVFEGFLPHKKGRKSRLAHLSREDRSIILYESPHRLVKTLRQLAEILGEERPASVSRELTKVYEETLNGTLTELAGLFEERKLKGEYVIVVSQSA